MGLLRAQYEACADSRAEMVLIVSRHFFYQLLLHSLDLILMLQMFLLVSKPRWKKKRKACEVKIGKTWFKKKQKYKLVINLPRPRSAVSPLVDNRPVILLNTRKTR